jgi:hypothetical protein
MSRAGKCQKHVPHSTGWQHPDLMPCHDDLPLPVGPHAPAAGTRPRQGHEQDSQTRWNNPINTTLHTQKKRTRHHSVETISATHLEAGSQRFDFQTR